MCVPFWRSCCGQILRGWLSIQGLFWQLANIMLSRHVSNSAQFMAARFWNEWVCGCLRVCAFWNLIYCIPLAALYDPSLNTYLPLYVMEAATSITVHESWGLMAPGWSWFIWRYSHGAISKLKRLLAKVPPICTTFPQGAFWNCTRAFDLAPCLNKLNSSNQRCVTWNQLWWNDMFLIVHVNFLINLWNVTAFSLFFVFHNMWS